MLNQTLSYIEKILTVSALLATSTSLPEYGHLTSLRSGSKYIAASIWEKMSGGQWRWWVTRPSEKQPHTYIKPNKN